jgi:nucleoside-diphosphate-sugar epimerase
MSFAVFGANSFFGSALVRKLISKGEEVYSIYWNKIDNLPAIRNYNISIKEFKNLNRQIKYVIFAMGSFNLEEGDFLQIENTIKESVKYFNQSRVVLISTTNLYHITDSLISSKSSISPSNQYEFHKLRCEQILRDHRNNSTIRFTYLYGPSMKKNSLIPQWILSALKENKVTIYGNGSRRNDYLYIDDAIELTISVADSEFQGTFIGASGYSISNLSLAQTICHLIPETQIIIESGKADRSFSYVFDISDTCKKTKWKPYTSLNNGLKTLLLNDFSFQ